ncbi:hypothetical protein OAL99_02905 [Gammaproteobacteria bacterium]|nr:hypothetical protein [Gammaproteobacteria bacterium]
MSQKIEDSNIETQKTSYLKKHWLGHHSLARAFWVNNWLISISLSFSLFAWMLISSENEDPVFFARVILAYTFLNFLIVFPWQVVGLWRTTSRYIESKLKIIWAWLVRIILLFGITFSTVSEIEDIDWYKQLYFDAFVLSKNQNYDVKIYKDNLVINGNFDYGISDKVNDILDKNKNIKTVILNSEGGLLYEANQISKTILLNSLNTYTYDECSSACTIAFISGNKRYIHESAKLGFHKYSIARPGAKIDQLDMMSLFMDQKKDAEFFEKRGVSKEFTHMMYQADSNEMWYPSIFALKYYGLIHGTK